jgi:uncharacterized protein (DUF433 family)
MNEGRQIDREMEGGMSWERYLDFVAEDIIRIKGTRVGIETVIGDYRLGAAPEEIVIHYPTLTLQQVYATITYYLENRPAVDAYLERVRQRREQDWQEQERRPSDFVRSLRERLDRERTVLREEGGIYSLPDAEE